MNEKILSKEELEKQQITQEMEEGINLVLAEEREKKYQKQVSK